MEFLFESKNDANLDEAHFEGDDYAKDNYKYLGPVIHDIVHTGELKLGDKVVEKTVKIDKSIQAEFAKYEGHPETLPRKTFDALLKNNSAGKISWRSIHKGTYSGKNGSTDGQYAEAAVAYVFNAMNGKSNVVPEAEGNEVLNKVVNVLKAKNIEDEWIASSKISAEKIHKSVENPKNYTAAHVDGKDISDIPAHIKKIAMIFHGKPGILSVLGSKIDKKAVKSLYSGQKDTWNKADIVLVNNDFNIDEATKDMFFSVSDQFNQFLNELINKQYIIPISLKMIKPNATLNQIIFKKEGYTEEEQQDSQEINELKTAKVDVILPVKALPTDESHKYAATCYLKTSTGLEVDFRAARADKPRLSIEIKLKTARGGKGMTELKNQLNLESNFYRDVTFDSSAAFFEELKELTGQTLTISKKVEESDPKWFLRPAFKGLIALLRIYRERIEHKTSGQVNLNNFFIMLYNCASGANSKSIFWLLTMV